MIVKIQPNGTSFSGVAAYLTHDPDQAKTSERVAWTHTHNLANDDVPCAVNEMVWTARDAELLKQQAGVRAGGRATESPVKHCSLNWSPEDRPSREHMIETAEGFLRRMNWHEHQAILVAHQDKAYAHVHIMLNTIHPETGLKLDENFEYRRAQAWALEYERAQDHVYCEERLKSAADREKAMPRNVWCAFQAQEKEFTRAEQSLRKNEPIFVHDLKNRENEEWEILKEIQRAERTQFFSDGKQEFSQLRKSIYRELREEFRPLWAAYYANRKEGIDPDTFLIRKAEIVEQQKAILDARRDEACTALRASRDQRYRLLLDRQRGARAELRWSQELGLDNALFLNELAAKNAETGITAKFGRSAGEVTTRHHAGGHDTKAGDFTARPDRGRTGATARDEGVGAGRVTAGVASFFDSLFFDLINLGSAPQQATPRDPFDVAAEEASKQQQQREREENDAAWRRRQRSPHGE
jgi:hypothetical protein